MDKRFKYLEVSIYYVFRGNFNDSYYIDTVFYDLNDFISEELVWIDPYDGRSKINNTLVSFKCCDDGCILLEKVNDTIKERDFEPLSLHICCEDYDNSRMLAAHIQLRMNK